jgi:predicted metal-binding membrane protein
MMLTAFAGGVMSVWMAALGVLALLEQIAPEGEMLRRALGGVFVAAAIARIV